MTTPTMHAALGCDACRGGGCPGHTAEQAMKINGHRINALEEKLDVERRRRSDDAQRHNRQIRALAQDVTAVGVEARQDMTPGGGLGRFNESLPGPTYFINTRAETAESALQGTIDQVAKITEEHADRLHNNRALLIAIAAQLRSIAEPGTFPSVRGDTLVNVINVLESMTKDSQ